MPIFCQKRQLLSKSFCSHVIFKNFTSETPCCQAQNSQKISILSKLKSLGLKIALLTIKDLKLIPRRFKQFYMSLIILTKGTILSLATFRWPIHFQGSCRNFHEKSTNKISLGFYNRVRVREWAGISSSLRRMSLIWISRQNIQCHIL